MHVKNMKHTSIKTQTHMQGLKLWAIHSRLQTEEGKREFEEETKALGETVKKIKEEDEIIRRIHEIEKGEREHMTHSHNKENATRSHQ